jgi:hypothetical protein
MRDKEQLAAAGPAIAYASKGAVVLLAPALAVHALPSLPAIRDCGDV